MMTDRQWCAKKAIENFAFEHGGGGEVSVKHDRPNECDGYYQWIAPDGRFAGIGWRA